MQPLSSQALPASRNTSHATDDETLVRIAEAVRFLAVNRERQPSLAETAAAAGMSPSHFQRVFTVHVGISPKRFVGHLTLQSAKAELRDKSPVLGAALAAGLSGPGRLHDLFVSFEAMTPGEYKSRGRGLFLTYGFHPTPFGLLLCIASPRGIAGLAFADTDARPGAAPSPVAPEGEDLWSPEAALADMRARLPEATYTEELAPAREIASLLFEPAASQTRREIRLAVTGTNFQVRVWEALVRLPLGHTTTYADLAREVCTEKASRAVAGAVGRNPVSFVIPCHRVLRSDGGLGGYHWGLTRKRALLAWESGIAAEA